MNRISQIISLFLVSAIAFSVISCDDKPDDIPQVYDYNPGEGVFIINEGLFNHGNASVSYYDLNKMTVKENVFYHANNEMLGDLAQSFTVDGDDGYIVMNNSDKVIIVDMHDMKKKGEITGLSSPRFLEVYNGKAYISDLEEEFLHIADLQTNTVTGSIPMGKSAEKMIRHNNLLFVVNWSNFYTTAENNTVMVIDLDTDQVVDSLVVTKEPNSLVIDKNNKLWVLCSGGYLNEEFPALHRFDLINFNEELVLGFPDKTNSPNNLTINKAGDKLYYLNNGLCHLLVTDFNLPSGKLIDMSTAYGLGLEPESGDLFLSDPADYQSKGKIYRYNSNGLALDTFDAGILPSYFLFY